MVYMWVKYSVCNYLDSYLIFSNSGKRICTGYGKESVVLADMGIVSWNRKRKCIFIFFGSDTGKFLFFPLHSICNEGFKYSSILYMPWNLLYFQN